MKNLMLVVFAALSLSFTAAHAAELRFEAPTSKVELAAKLALTKSFAADTVAAEAPAVPADAAAAQYKEPKDIGEVIGMVPTLVSFVKNGQWLLFGAMVSMILTFFIRQYGLSKLGASTAWLPILAPILGIVSGVGGAVLAGATPLAAALAVMSGPLASNLWEAIVKHFFPRAPEEVRQG